MSKVVAAGILAAGAVVAVVAVVISLIPFGTDGSASPTAAFRAQHDLDEVMFKLATSPAAMFTGKLTYTYQQSGMSGAVDFTDLTATSSNNVQGTISVAGQQGEYRQISNRFFVSAPKAFWNPLLTQAQLKDKLDFGPVDNKWADATYSYLPNLGVQLSSNNLAGIVSNTETAAPPALGQPVPGSSPGLPDQRFWPNSDPAVSFIGDNLVRVGTWEVAFDPSTKMVTHLKGRYERFGDKYTLDTAVKPMSLDETQSLFANQRSIVPELTSVPAPGLAPDRLDPIDERPAPGCVVHASMQNCTWNLAVSGKTNHTAVIAGHFNFGITATFKHDTVPAGGTCRVVVRADFGRTGQSTCTATNIPLGGQFVYISTRYTFLGFTDSTVDDLTTAIADTQTRTGMKLRYVRTGSKDKAAAQYSTGVTALPSFFGIEQNGYVFDSVSTNSRLIVIFSTGYGAHVTNGVFDPSWAGTTTIKQQLDKQVQAAGATQIYYEAAEQPAADALQALVKAAGHDDRITVYYSPQ